MIARREIPEGEPVCFTGNSKWLFVLNYRKPWLIQRARGRFATQVIKFSNTNSLSFDSEFIDELEL